MERKWSYGDYDVREGLKPGSRHFQYFFVISKGGEKRCKYCVWIEDAALPLFHESGSFEEIVSARREEWARWVQGKLDADDLRAVVRKLGPGGEEEFDLAELDEKLTLQG
jgi:hypothetical protein